MTIATAIRRGELAQGGFDGTEMAVIGLQLDGLLHGALRAGERVERLVAVLAPGEDVRLVTKETLAREFEADGMPQLARRCRKWPVPPGGLLLWAAGEGESGFSIIQDAASTSTPPVNSTHIAVATVLGNLVTKGV